MVTRWCCEGGDDPPRPDRHARGDGDSECYGSQASALAEKILPPGTRVRIATDAGLDEVDRDGLDARLCLEGRLARQPAARARGRGGAVLLCGRRGKLRGGVPPHAAVTARKAHRGLWGRVQEGRGPAAGHERRRDRDRCMRRRSLRSGANPRRLQLPNYTPCVPNSATDLDCPESATPSRSSARTCTASTARATARGARATARSGPLRLQRLDRAAHGEPGNGPAGDGPHPAVRRDHAEAMARGGEVGESCPAARPDVVGEDA